MLGFFRKLIDKQNEYLTKNYNGDRIKMYSARVICNISMSSILVLFSMFIVGFFIPDELMDARTRAIFQPQELLLSLLFTASYVQLVRGNYQSGSAIFSVTAVCGLLLGVLLTGGFPYSVASPSLILMPIIIYCVYGAKAGLSAALLAPAFTLVVGPLMAFSGLPIPDFTSNANPALNSAIVIAITYCIAVFVVSSYEYQNRQLLKELDAERQNMANIANADGLTGLANNRKFDEVLSTACDKVNSSGGEIAILYIDVNHFKSINDDYGHLGGDCVLRHIADRISYTVPGGSEVARIGGDEFTVLVTSNTDEESLEDLKSRLKYAIAKPLSMAGDPYRVGVSIGFARSGGGLVEKNSLIHQADLAMYRDKQRGRENAHGIAASLKAALIDAA